MIPVNIIGGGLAGLTLGIALGQRDVPVTIMEAGRYPRHRVCGEFVSGGGRVALQRLGLEEKLFAAGAREGHTATFFSARRKYAVALPQPALCLSRFRMDAALADEFVRLGGELCQNHRAPRGEGEGIIHATGRQTHAVVKGWRWFGLKVHARRVQLETALEMHLLRDGYVGICQIDSKTVNVCGLFRARAPVPDLSNTWPEWLRGRGEGPLRERLANVEFCADSFCSVAGLSLEPQSASQTSECRVGDAITMISPLTGNGMSMAFESAELAAEPLRDYSAGKIPWRDAVTQIAGLCDRAFARRLRWANWLQYALLNPSGREPLLWLAAQSPAVWRALFARTR